MKTTFAHCDASGAIAFGFRVPKGSVAIARGREDALRDLLCATSRHAHDGETLLVPGIPEAVNQIKAVDALMDFGDWLAPRQTEGVTILCARQNTWVARDVPVGESFAATGHRTLAEIDGISDQEMALSRACCTDGIPKPEVIYQDVPAHPPYKIREA